MSNLATALRIATSGMQTSQLGLSTVSHNVTNANTVGYTRQEVKTTNVSYNGFGVGVQIGDISRATDRFLNTRVFNQLSELDYTTTRRAYMDTVEGAFTGASAEASLDNIVSRMFQSFNNLANDPGNSALKRNAVQQVDLLTDTIRAINEDLTDIAARVNNQITEEIDELNLVLRRVYELNLEIATQNTSLSNGANPNDLLDERDRQLDELAKRFKLKVNADSTGTSIRVTTESGQKLVDQNSYVQFERTAGTPYQGIGFRNVLVDGSLASYVNTLNTSNLTTGRIKSLLDMRDTTVPNMLAQLDELANTIRTELNTVASQGSAFPPQRTLASGNTTGVTDANSDLLTELSGALNNASFQISVVDSQGDVVNTTLGNGGPITITGAPTLSINDIVDAINNNADVGVTTLGAGLGITASAQTDANGRPYLQLQASNANYAVVISAVNGDFPGLMGFNNILTGTGSGDIAVRSDLEADPALFPTGRMRSTDGGLSSLSNANIIALAQMADTNVAFDPAGGLAGQNVTMVGYVGQMTSNLAVTMNDASTKEQYADMLYNQLLQLKGSVGGVNMDEELALMLVYQQGFQASARIITVVDGLLQELMNIVR